jgi:glutamate-ammonia-ligase adenylyltransferase
LTPEVAQRYSLIHPRCGTAFLLWVMVVSVFVYALLGRPVWYWLIISRIVLLPVIAGIAYELIRFAGKHTDNRVLMTLLAPGLPMRESIEALIDTLLVGGRTLASALRVARHLVLERLAVLDIEQGAEMQDITRSMTQLAETTLNRALVQSFADQDARHGPPLNPAGERIDFWVVGMGKLGAHELNVSSDIDLIYVYEEDGQTTGPKVISAHEYFSQVARSLYGLIGDSTDDGFVFRVDLALRPNGNSGPTAVSLAML